MPGPSFDRVSFHLSDYRVAKDLDKYRDILGFAFGLTPNEFFRACSSSPSEAMRRGSRPKSAWGQPLGVTITCRPSQFARFLIRRNDLGLPTASRS